MADGRPYDLLVIGGGINGAGIARDAAGRGLSVLLCEQNDLGSATSSASSKLIHGGLRYLEYYEFRLVREALAEREALLGIAPHIIKPMRFVLPHDRQLRPAWMIWAGLFLYDHLAGRSRLPGSRRLDLRREAAGRPLRADFKTGFIYSDCWVDDSRLVVLNAMDAEARGATILPRWRCVSARALDGVWHVELRGTDGAVRRERASVLVNAAGPWVGAVLNEVAAADRPKRLRLVKGSHIVVPRLYDGEHAYILQNTDRRVVFVIPYQGRFSLVGTTDIPYDGDPADVRITADEASYLCDAVNHCFAKPISTTDVVWSYSGVRPLYDDESDNPSAVTRDYVFDIAAPKGMPPLLSIFGGKITTYRKLAEHAMEKLAPFLPSPGRSWTDREKLPGGDIPNGDVAAYGADLLARHPWLTPSTAHRFAQSYGTLAERILDGAASEADLGRDFGGGLTEREVDHLVRREWAMCAEDILWRRTKLGLHVTPDVGPALDGWLSDGRRMNATQAVAR